MITTQQQADAIHRRKALLKRGIRVGTRRYYWVSFTGPDGLMYREFYLTARQAYNRELELAYDAKNHVGR